MSSQIPPGSLCLKQIMVIEKQRNIFESDQIQSSMFHWEA